jgi:small conductance mechanosensitive channel
MAVLALFLAVPMAMAEDPPQAQTVADPEIRIEELELLLKPQPKSQLLVEADAWQVLLQEKAEEIAGIEVAIKRENLVIAQAEETRELAEEAKTQLEKTIAQPEAAATEDGKLATAKAANDAAKAQESIEELKQAAASTYAGEIAKALQDDAASVEAKTQVLENVAATVTREAEARKESKVTLVEQVTLLRSERTAVVDRLRTVLEELQNKTDEADSDTLAKIRDLELYAKTFSRIEVEVDDTTSAWIAIKGWLVSDEGGKRWAFNIAKFLAILFAAWIISRVLSSAVRHALSRVDGTSRLLENFLVTAVRRTVMAIGLIMALAALEVTIAPLLAIVGAAGFVIAFALQDSLSNFASGLMILFFRPFDEGDIIEAGGVSGKVQSMNLVSTTVLTFDNKRMVVPNNKIWNDVITNATGVTERRIDMEFGIGYDDDIDKANDILVDIVSSHPKVLKEPEPTVRMHTLADSSINFIARPWAKTADYWDIYWDVTRAVKQRFDAAGIGIPFPQRDVHLYLKGDDSKAALLSPDKAPPRPQKPDSTVRDDGGLDDDTD